jgi:class 3 adenylate cyclase
MGVRLHIGYGEGLVAIVAASPCLRKACPQKGRELLMTEQRINRRLAAILAAYVVGYSRLMGADEAGTLAALKRPRRRA